MAPHQTSREHFDAIFREHNAAVRAYVRRRVPGEAVDDVVSETFLAAWRRIDRLGDDPLPWLLGIARNVAGTERRGRSRRLRLWTKTQADFRGGAECFDEVVGGDGRVLAALGSLSEADREALILVAWDDLTPAQAAAVLGVPANRFRVRLHRASRRLRLTLDTDGSEEKRPHRPPPTQLHSKGASR